MQRQNLDPPIEVEARGTTTASVIWLHGLGADGHDFEPLVPELSAAGVAGVRYVFPRAPRQPVTINGGMVMRAWYDIVDQDIGRHVDAQGIRSSGEILAALIARESERGIPSERIVLAGFSQGGAIALHTGVRHSRPLAGILALSCYLPLQEDAATEANADHRSMPIFMAHGTQDPVIPLAYSERSRAFLTSLGYVVETHTYPMPHAVCGEEVRDIADWLRRVLG